MTIDCPGRRGVTGSAGDLSRWTDATLSLENGLVFFEPAWAIRAAEAAGVLYLCETTDGSCDVDHDEGHDVPVWHLAEGKCDTDYDRVTGFSSWRSSLGTLVETEKDHE